MSQLLIGVFGVAACLALAGGPSFGQTQTPPAEKPAAAPEGTGGMRVYIDPQTGAISPDPAPATPPSAATERERNASSTSHQGLVEVPSSEPGGGVQVDLQGRFQSPLVGTMDADGKVRTRHLNRLPEPEDKR